MSPLRILFVDESAPVIDPLVLALRARGFAPLAGSAGRDAGLRGAVESFRPDLVVAAWTGEPGGVGAIVEAAGPAPVVVAGVPGGEAAVGACLDAGAWDCVARDEPSRLVHTVCRALSQVRLEGAAGAGVRQVSEWLRLWGDALPLALGQCDRAGRVTACNKAWTELVGAVASMAERVHADDQWKLEQSLSEAEPGGPLTEVSLRWRRPDSVVRYVWIRLGAFPDSCAGDHRLFVWIRESAELKPTLPGAVRHEINNHLAVVRMFADFLGEAPGMPAAYAAKAREIGIASDKATQVVRRLSGNPGT